MTKTLNFDVIKGIHVTQTKTVESEFKDTMMMRNTGVRGTPLAQPRIIYIKKYIVFMDGCIKGMEEHTSFESQLNEELKLAMRNGNV